MKCMKNLLAGVATLLIGYTGFGGYATFSPSTLPDATVGKAYSQTVNISTDLPLIDLFDNTTFPNGYGLSIGYDSGAKKFTISGTPVTAAKLDFTVTALLIKDGAGYMESANFSINVNAASGGGGESGGGGDKVEFSVKSPATGTVNVTLGATQFFEVEASGDTKECTINWTLVNGKTNTSLGSALYCEFKSSDYGAGTYYLYFSGEDKSGNKSEYSWTIVVADSGGTTPTASITAASPELLDCSTAALAKESKLSLADKQVQTFSLTVETTASSLVYRWMNGNTGADLPGSSTTSPSCNYTHSAADYEVFIYCMVFDANACDPSKDTPLCHAVWCIEAAPVELNIVSTPAVTDGMVDVAYGPVQFALEGGLGVEWDPLPQLTMVREAGSFSAAAAETAAGADGVTYLSSIQQGGGGIMFR